LGVFCGGRFKRGGVRGLGLGGRAGGMGGEGREGREKEPKGNETNERRFIYPKAIESSAPPKCRSGS